jgi:hypothetical protein
MVASRWRRQGGFIVTDPAKLPRSRLLARNNLHIIRHVPESAASSSELRRGSLFSRAAGWTDPPGGEL